MYVPILRSVGSNSHSIKRDIRATIIYIYISVLYFILNIFVKFELGLYVYKGAFMWTQIAI